MMLNSEGRGGSIASKKHRHGRYMEPVGYSVPHRTREGLLAGVEFSQEGKVGLGLDHPREEVRELGKMGRGERAQSQSVVALDPMYGLQ
jgi:hypothetical protein